MRAAFEALIKACERNAEKSTLSLGPNNFEALRNAMDYVDGIADPTLREITQKILAIEIAQARVDVEAHNTLIDTAHNIAARIREITWVRFLREIYTLDGDGARTLIEQGFDIETTHRKKGRLVTKVVEQANKYPGSHEQNREVMQMLIDFGAKITEADVHAVGVQSVRAIMEEAYLKQVTSAMEKVVSKFSRSRP